MRKQILKPNRDFKANASKSKTNIKCVCLLKNTMRTTEVGKKREK